MGSGHKKREKRSRDREGAGAPFAGQWSPGLRQKLPPAPADSPYCGCRIVGPPRKGGTIPVCVGKDIIVVCVHVTRKSTSQTQPVGSPSTLGPDVAGGGDAGARPREPNVLLHRIRTFLQPFTELFSGSASAWASKPYDLKDAPRLLQDVSGGSLIPKR